MTTDHLARAKEYIAKGDEYYAKAADEVAAWLDEDASRTQVQAAERLGKSESWISRLLRARKNCDGESTQVEWFSGSNKRDEVAERVLSDPEQRKQVIASLPADVREAVITESNAAALADIQAKRAEHDTTPKAPTAGDLMGDTPFDPSESWADTDIIRVQEKAHLLRRQVEKWGLVLGSLSEREAFGMLQEAERNIAEVRVVLQERMADRNQAEV